MLRFLPVWWQSFMLWLDTATIPLWVVVVVIGVALVYLIYIAWHDLTVALRDPPPFD